MMNIFIRDNGDGTIQAEIVDRWGSSITTCESWEKLLEFLQTLKQPR